MTYYTIATYNNGRWAPQFGDYDLETVLDELTEYEDCGPVLLIRAPDDLQSTLDEILAQLSTPQ